MSISRRGKTWSWLIGGISILILLGIGLYLDFSHNIGSLHHLTARATVPAPAPVEDASAASADAQPIQISGAAECGCRDIAVREISPSHYVVSSTQQTATGGFYPLLKFTGLAGRTVEIDLEGAPFNKWGNIVPVYGYVKNLDDPAGFVSLDKPIVKDPDDYKATGRIGDRPALPNTAGQHWHYFTKAWHEGDAFCLVQHFTQDTAYVTDRVPYTPAYNEAYLKTIEHNPYVKVVLIGKSKQGRPLQLVQIPADATPEQLRAKPCVLIYAREHPDEQDSSWVAQGAIDFLISDDPQAAEVRKQVTVLVIPLLDPDGAEEGAHANIIASFVAGRETLESLQYSAFLRRWVAECNRLDMVFSLHDPPPDAAFHVCCPQMEPAKRRFDESMDFYNGFRALLVAAKFNVRHTPWGKGFLTACMSGFLSANYGTLSIPFEINSLTLKKQINLAQVRNIGKLLCMASVEYFGGRGKKLLADVDARRLNWRRETRHCVPAKLLATGNAIEIEAQREQEAIFEEAVLPGGHFQN